jgi:hypothetical protein
LMKPIFSAAVWAFLVPSFSLLAKLTMLRFLLNC